MTVDATSRRSTGDRSRSRALPGVLKLGLATVAFGLLLDLGEHSFAGQPAGSGGFGPGEHLAHFVVLLGMCLVLVGVAADGIRSQGRAGRPEGSSRDAVR
jgi:hypothetical protein